jgi:hypothetical protein
MPSGSAPAGYRTALWSWALGAFALSCLVAARCIALGTARGPSPTSIAYIYDDGYYYLTIAANLAEFGRSTFDGVTTTNGYHPLWLLLLSGVAKLTGSSPWPLFVGACQLIHAILLFTWLMPWLWRDVTARTIALCAVAGLAMPVLRHPLVFLCGTEAILSLPVLVGVVVVLEKERGAVAARRLAPLMALAFVVRLDSLALLVPAALVLAADERRTGRFAARDLLRTALSLVRFVVPAVGLYLVVNQWGFGVALPASGIAKALYGDGGARNWGAALQFVDAALPFMPLVLLLLVVEWMAHRCGVRSWRYYRSMLVTGLAGCIQMLYYGALSTWGLWPWYFYLVYVCIGLVFARVVHLSSLLARHRGAHLAAIILAAPVHLLVCVSGVALASHSLEPQHTAGLRSMLGPSPERAVTNVSFNEVSLAMLDSFFRGDRHVTVAMGDRSGGLAYWGRGKLAVVQTEGLTEDIRFVRALDRGQGAAELERRFAIDYMMVDREVIPRVRQQGVLQEYVVAEPIQARVGTRAGMIVCFPADAVRYDARYLDLDGAETRRMVFEFGQRIPCTRAARELIGSIAKGDGLRQLSHPSLYRRNGVATRRKRIEDGDRHGLGWSFRDILIAH